MWRERGGALRPDGFFELPVGSPPRAAASIPPRKRALYRRRRLILETLRKRLTHALDDPAKVPINQHEPIWL